MRFGEIIQTYIKSNQMTYRQFGDICGLSPGYLSMIINDCNPKTGRAPIPSISAYIRIGKAMGMTLDELFSRIDDAPVSLSIDDNESGNPFKLSAVEVKLILAYRSADDNAKRFALQLLENNPVQTKERHA